MRDWLSAVFAGRPTWMNVLMVFCAYMSFFYVPWDFFVKPAAHDEEVWLGIMFTGTAAKLTEPLHWLIYTAGAYGFYRRKRWMWPWAAIYAGSVTIGMLIWPIVYRDSWLVGFIAFFPFAWLTRELWRAESFFASRREPLRERYGSWALVTGASSGIGAEFARSLAHEGLAIVLTARRQERLDTLAADLRRAYGVETRVVAADLSTDEGMQQVADAISDLPIAIAVMNAGFGAAGPFDTTDRERLRDMVRLHCEAPVELTHRLLPGMQERGRGAVVFTGSVAAHQAVPLHGLYAASKAFQLRLGEALHFELREKNIDVLVLEPGVTDTEFQELAGERRLYGDPPSQVVESALEALGQQSSLVPRWFDWLRANAAERLVPRGLATAVARDVFAKRLD
jgi:short-subunit dehydrogenase